MIHIFSLTTTCTTTYLPYPFNPQAISNNNNNNNSNIMSEYVDDEAVTKSLRKQYERIGQRLLKKTRAYGKLILFGEHFVVYKVAALVGAVA
jgi:hypothetical protein